MLIFKQHLEQKIILSAVPSCTSIHRSIHPSSSSSGSLAVLGPVTSFPIRDSGLSWFPAWSRFHVPDFAVTADHHRSTTSSTSTSSRNLCWCITEGHSVSWQKARARRWKSCKKMVLILSKTHRSTHTLTRSHICPFTLTLARSSTHANALGSRHG